MCRQGLAHHRAAQGHRTRARRKRRPSGRGDFHARAAAVDSNISIATVYRTVRLFEEAGILERHEFGDGRSRFEAV